MENLEQTFSQANLDRVFPPERTDEFFDALFGDPSEGAYDIRLVLNAASPAKIRFLFELNQRGNACLACNLTHGLPEVFRRHKIINMKQVVEDLAALAGWEAGSWTWDLGMTLEISYAKHVIPLTLSKKA